MKAEIVREFSFEAAHRLPEVGTDHKCFRLHGHLFKVEVAIAGEVDPELGWVMDFGDLAREAGRIISGLDHRVLNDIAGLANPTSENISRYLFDLIAPIIPGVTAVTVHESPYSRCTYRPSTTTVDNAEGDFRVTATEIVFSAAHYLVFPPSGREPVHGHDYAVTVTGITSAPASGARETLYGVARSVIGPMEHRVLLASEPAAGTMTRDGDSIRMELDGTLVVLPVDDCYTLDETANSTTELIAEHIAKAIAANPQTRSAGFRAVEVDVLEGRDCRARVVARTPAD